MASVLWFEVVEGEGRGWMAMRDGAVAKLEHDTVDRSFWWKANGMRWVFHSFDNGLPRQMRGRLKMVRSAAGIVAKVEYGPDDEIARVVWRNADGTVTEFCYEYSHFGPALRLRTVTLLHQGEHLERVGHSYHPHGRMGGRLRQTRVERWRENRWHTEREAIYRYRGSSQGIRIKKPRWL